MTYNQMHRSGLTAIAAVFALSSTPLIAQATAAPDPLAAAPAAPVVESAPIAPPESAPVESTTTVSTTSVADPLAPAAAPVTRTTTRTTTVRKSSAAAQPTRLSTATPAANAPVPAAPLAIEPAAAAPIVAVPLPIDGGPAVEATPAATDPSSASSDDMLPIAAGAAAGLLALFGAGFALRRRKQAGTERADWSAIYAAPAPNAAITPAPVDALLPRHDNATPAIAWTAATPTTAGRVVDRSDDLRGSHVDAAYRGPSDTNPSLSLKKRLKRAAFFDQRERLVAAGEALPVARDAGLPDALPTPQPPRTPVTAEAVRRRELQPA